MAASYEAIGRTFTFCRPHDDDGSNGSLIEASVEVFEAPHSDFGLFLWPSGEVLAWYLWQHPEVPPVGCSCTRDQSYEAHL
jgi:hypothetical protein